MGGATIVKRKEEKALLEEAKVLEVWTQILLGKDSKDASWKNA